MMPRRNDDGRLEVSVCRSTGLSDKDVWNICTEHFDPHVPSRAIGRGVGTADVVLAEGLTFDPNGKPYPEHADIVGWYEQPGVPDEELKSSWRDKAQRLAPHFRYVPRP